MRNIAEEMKKKRFQQCFRNWRSLAVGWPCRSGLWRSWPWNQLDELDQLNKLDKLNKLDDRPAEEGEHWHQQELVGSQGVLQAKLISIRDTNTKTQISKIISGASVRRGQKLQELASEGANWQGFSFSMFSIIRFGGKMKINHVD